MPLVGELARVGSQCRACRALLAQRGGPSVLPWTAVGALLALLPKLLGLRVLAKPESRCL